MDMIQYDAAGAPWLDQPTTLDGARDPSYNLTDAQFAYVSQYWLFWYEADHRYALPTVALFLAVIIAFSLAGAVTRFGPASLRRSRLYRRMLAGCRYLSYKSWRISFLHWYSPSAGVWLVGILGAIFFLCMMLAQHPYYWPNTATVNFGNSPPVATRSGWMSVACLPFVLVLAAKENPISFLTGVPHDQLMVFHRWAAWAMFVLALVHTFPFIVYHILEGDVVVQWQTNVFWWTGVVALLAQAWLQFMSIGFIRNAFYETFRALHYIMATLFWVFLLFHCDSTLTSWQYLTGAAVVYAACLATSQLRTWAEHGISKATIEPLPSGVVCIRVPSNSTWAPGQHIFVRIFSKDLHGLTSHPFTICSLPIDRKLTTEKAGNAKNEMVMYVQPRGGMTRRLASLAEQRPARSIRVMLDGPYGGMKFKSQVDFDRGLLIAGGAGAGFTIPIVESFLLQANSAETNGDSTKSLRVVLAVKTAAECEWYASVMQELLSLYVWSRSLVRVDVFVTGANTSAKIAEKDEEAASNVGEASGNDDGPKHAAISFQHGHRPDLAAIIRETVTAAKQSSVGVVVCGPSSMLFDVRQAVSAAQIACLRGDQEEIYLYSEHFGW